MLNLGDDENKTRWRRLESLLEMLGQTSLSRLTKAEVREFGELYRRAAADLAIARAESRDPMLVSYLNSLVIRAHGEIYRAESGGKTLVKEFFLREFPRTFRRHWKFTLASFLFFTSFAVLAFILAYQDPEFVRMAGLEPVALQAELDSRWWNSLNRANEIGSAQILTNNIAVAFNAFAYGALLGIGSVYVLVLNGIHIGGVLGVCFSVNPAFGHELVTFIFAHGVVELSCIFMAGGAGMRLGYSIIDPGDLTRMEAVKKNGIDAVKIAIGCAVLLFLAGIIEGFVSPSTLHPAVKYGTGIATGAALFAYLILTGDDEG